MKLPKLVNTVSWGAVALAFALLLFTEHTQLALCLLLPSLIWCWYWNIRAARQTLASK